MERQTKTPDEIKKGLEVCSDALKTGNCPGCPYYKIFGCADKVLADALALIQQLEIKDAEKAQRIAELEHELAAAKRERDAAVYDIGHFDICNACIHGFSATNDCPAITEDGCKYEWRGVCPENTEVQDGE